MVAGTANAIDAPDAGDPALFGSDSVLRVQLHGPLQKLLDDVSNQQRTFRITAGGKERTVAISTGGRSRRRVCDFLPLRLEFGADADREPPDPNSVFSGQHFLYLTTQCRSNTRSQADLVEEYLAYRILNLITEASYRVRLLRVDYIDPGEAENGNTHYAFVTESQQALARRMGGAVLNISHVPKRRLNEDHAALVYVFQYLIGNTDWSLVAGADDDTCCHNGQLIDVDRGIFYVPYDFDLAGLVNPPYARPDRSLPIRKVTQRLYRGYCGPEDALGKAIDHVVDRREAILALYNNAPALSRSERDRGTRYLERFFDQAENREKMLMQFQGKCLGEKVRQEPEPP